MEALVEKIVDDVKKRIADYGYGDQWTICEELSRRIAEVGDEALREEYMIADVEGGES